ncbi:hypothetical protein ACNR91_004255 [Candidozyma auris]
MPCTPSVKNMLLISRLARSPPHDCNATVIGSYYNGFVVIPYNLTTQGYKLTGASKIPIG